MIEILAALAFLYLCIWLDDAKIVRRKKPEKDEPPTFI